MTAYGDQVLIFAGYGEGDQKPPLEVLTPGKSLVAHLEYGGDPVRLHLDISAKGISTHHEWICD